MPTGSLTSVLLAHWSFPWLLVVLQLPDLELTWVTKERKCSTKTGSKLLKLVWMH